MYVIVEVPPPNAETKPVLFTDATAVLDDVQALLVAAVPEPVSCEVNPVTAESVPEMVGLAIVVAPTVELVTCEQPFPAALTATL